MTKLYHDNEGGGWQLPGKQSKRAARVDVPSQPLELAAWLNERWVQREPHELTLADQLAIGEAVLRDPKDGGGAVIDQAEVDKVNATRPAFLGKLTVEEIERHRMAMGQCPKCSSSPAAAERWRRDLDFEGVRAWIEENATALGLDELSDLIEEKRK